MKRWINIVVFLIASVGAYVLIHEMTHLFFCLVNPDVEVLKFNFGINNSVVWISENIGRYSELISYSSNILLFILPFLLFLSNTKKKAKINFMAMTFVLINIIILSVSVFFEIQQELLWLNSVGIFRYILLILFTMLFIIFLIDLRETRIIINPRIPIIIMLMQVLTYFVVILLVDINFNNDYSLEGQITIQDNLILENSTYLLRNETNNAIEIVIISNYSSELVLTINKGQFVKMTCNEEQRISLLCSDCSRDVVLSVYKACGGD
jgi:hypothetical protein